MAKYSEIPQEQILMDTNKNSILQAEKTLSANKSLFESLGLSIELIKNAKPKITVIGDLILDEYLIGYPERISREAPILILEYKENFYRLGGAANAAINASKLGAEVTLIGSVGQDKASEEMAEICELNQINFQPIISASKPTTLKTRILAANQASSLTHSGTAHNQQVLRIDRQSKADLDSKERDQLIQKSLEYLPSSDSVLLSDYALGVLSQEVSQELIQAASKHKVKVIADPSSSFDRFRGVFLITPNEPDTEKELVNLIPNASIPFDSRLLDSGLFDSEAGIKQIQKSLQEILSDRTAFLITRGAEGMILLDGENFHSVPAFNKAEVFDVTGAGDTVSACISVAIAAGVSLKQSMYLGNLAASIVVRKTGAATTSMQEMEKALSELSS